MFLSRSILKLGEKLKQFRKLNSLSLRDVEDKTGISNAYLSQLERGSAKNPSPGKLELLADVYTVPYPELLKLAGYLKDIGIPSGDKLVASTASDRPTSILATVIQDTNLTEEEESLVTQYIAFLKSQR